MISLLLAKALRSRRGHGMRATCRTLKNSKLSQAWLIIAPSNTAEFRQQIVAAEFSGSPS